MTPSSLLLCSQDDAIHRLNTKWPITNLLITAAVAMTALMASPSHAQVGVIESDDPGGTTYKLVNVYSGLRADVMWASTNPLQGVFLWPNNDSLSQRYSVLYSGNGYFRLQAQHSQQCLMRDWEHMYDNGSPVIQYPFCDPGYAGGEWTWRYMGNRPSPNGIGPNIPSFVLVNRATGLCLDVVNGNGGVPSQQSALQLEYCVTGVNQPRSPNQLWGFFVVDPPENILLHIYIPPGK